MKQKMVIKVSWMTNPKSRNKALRFVAGFPGVESVALAGDDKSDIVVIGDEVDAVKLTILMRKKFAKPFCWLRHKMGYVELVTVTPVDDKEEVKTTPAPEPVVQTEPSICSYRGSSIPYRVVYDHYPSSCPIL